MNAVAPSAIPLIPVGSLILVRLDEDPTAPANVWEVITDGKAILVDESYPEGEIEDLDNFAPASIYVLGAKVPF